MGAFETKAKLLIAADLKDLEIAATLVYFQRQDGDWSSAAEKTRKFKSQCRFFVQSSGGLPEKASDTGRLLRFVTPEPLPRGGSPP